MTQRIRTMVVGSVALAAAAACSRAAPSGTDDALRADLDAAQAAAAGPADRTQFVSPVELGRAATPRAEASGAVPSAGARVATSRRARASAPAPVARPVSRVRAPDPAPAPAEEAERAVDAPAPVAESAPPPRDEPVVAAPSRRPAPERGPGRRGRVWDMGDVIRNAPFPINP